MGAKKLAIQCGRRAYPIYMLKCIITIIYLFVFFILCCRRNGVTNHMDVYSLCIQTNTWPAGGAGRREKSRLQYIHLDKWEILGGARAREIAIIAWARARARARAIIISLI